MDDFLNGSPRLDVLVEECDSFQLKLLVRERARHFGIPVVMESSDRSTMDVERFDLEPERPILHGFVEGVDAKTVDQLSRDEQVALGVRLVGAENLSAKIASSMVEIGETLATWPQLAADVMTGGGHICMAVRELGLGHKLDSGRRFLDPMPSIKATPSEMSPTFPPELVPPRPRAEEDVQNLTEDMRAIVRAASMAPSGGNAQPWRFFVDGLVLWLVLDRRRSDSLLDFDDRASILGLGAACENAVIAATSRGLQATVHSYPNPNDRNILARLDFSPCSGSGADRLAPFIEKRCSNRTSPTRKPLSSRQQEIVSEAATEAGAELSLLTHPEDLSSLALSLGRADRIRLLNPGLHRELMGEIRWTPSSAERSGDGVDLRTLALKTGQETLLRLLARQAGSQVKDKMAT